MQHVLVVLLSQSRLGGCDGLSVSLYLWLDVSICQVTDWRHHREKPTSARYTQHTTSGCEGLDIALRLWGNPLCVVTAEMDASAAVSDVKNLSCALLSVVGGGNVPMLSPRAGIIALCDFFSSRHGV